MNPDVTSTGDSILIKSEPQWQYNDGDEIDTMSMPSYQPSSVSNINIEGKKTISTCENPNASSSNINENSGIKCEKEEEEMLGGMSLKDLNGSLKQEVLEDEGEVQFDEGCEEERQQVVNQEPGDITAMNEHCPENEMEYEDDLRGGVSVKEGTPSSLTNNQYVKQELPDTSGGLKDVDGDVFVLKDTNQFVFKLNLSPFLPNTLSSPNGTLSREFTGDGDFQPNPSSLCKNDVLYNAQQHSDDMEVITRCIQKKSRTSLKHSSTPSHPINQKRPLW